jgi:hypothetical protein
MSVQALFMTFNACQTLATKHISCMDFSVTGSGMISDRPVHHIPLAGSHAKERQALSPDSLAPTLHPQHDWHDVSFTFLAGNGPEPISRIKVVKTLQSVLGENRSARSVDICLASGIRGTKIVIRKSANEPMSEHEQYNCDVSLNMLHADVSWDSDDDKYFAKIDAAEEKLRRRKETDLYDEFHVGRIMQDQSDVDEGYETFGIATLKNGDEKKPMLLAEYIHGINSKALLRASARTQDSLEYMAVFKNLYKGMLMRALALERNGYVDPDHKPINYVIDENGRPRGIDNGLVIETGERARGHTAGYNNYIPNEIKNKRGCNGKTDVYQIASHLRLELDKTWHLFSVDELFSLEHLLKWSMKPISQRLTLTQALIHPYFLSSREADDVEISRQAVSRELQTSGQAEYDQWRSELSLMV